MKVVQFSDGEYGIRKWSLWVLGYAYKDLCPEGNPYWWSRTSDFFVDCRGDENTVSRTYNLLTSKGKPAV